VVADLGVAVLGEQEIAGRRRAHRRVRPGTARAAPGYGDLRPGDYVVHHRHGIGRFEGLTTQALGGIERDYILVAYAGQDRLYVPTDQLAAVRTYTGGEAPRLSRMGGADWERTRTKVRKAVAVVAQEVVALHRERARATGHAYAADTPWQREMEASFPYEETADQVTAIADVKADMEADAPMDRLIFGDVGFGKTEVAIRGVFKAVQDGRQAAVLVPTTLLAQQHFQTFSERFGPYPIRVEMLSRFLTARQQKGVVAGIAAGSVDVVIGLWSAFRGVDPAEAAEVDRILHTGAGGDARPRTQVEYQLGESVKVTSGPLSDFDGEIVEVNGDAQKLKVLVDIFERQVPVELAFDQVKKID